MRRRKERPILVTGSHRSGTTWMGAVLASAEGVGYVHEPFNPTVRVDDLESPVVRWFESVERANRGAIKAYLDGILSRRDSARVLIKDPIAVFAARWFHRRYGARVVVMVRHPAAFVGSLKVKGWRHDFRDFAEQRGLMRRFGRRDREVVQSFIETPGDIIAEGILLWRLIYGEVARWGGKRWCLLVYHEQLSKDPAGAFGTVFEWVGLPYGDAIREKVRSLSEGEDRPDPDGGFGLDDLQRNSLANLERWRERLSAEEIERIREGVGELGARFYGKDYW